MIVSTITLSQDGKYEGLDNYLPIIEDWNIELVKVLCKDKYLSDKGIELVKDITHEFNYIDKWQEPEVGITIDEIYGLTDLLIVVNSECKLPMGKDFDFSLFEPIVQDTKVELWKRK